jgi:hypothetical protein
MHTTFLLESQKDVDHLEDLSLDGIIILRYFFKNWKERVELGQLAHGSCEYGNELSGPIKDAEFND